MAHAFVNITENLARLCATHDLLTPNERLAREYQFAYDAYQQTQGATGWPTLRCTSLTQYLNTQLKQYKDTVLLADSEPVGELIQTHALLGHIVQNAPVSTRSIIQVFAAAWQSMQRYDIPVDVSEFATPRMQDFRIWYASVLESLPSDAILPERLGDKLISLDARPARPLILLDFEQLTAVESRYLIYAASHTEVLSSDLRQKSFTAWEPREKASSVTASSNRPSSEALFGFKSLTEEVAAAADWAHDIKKKQGDACIGIVVPDLAQNYELVQHQCALMLDPKNGSLTNAFDLSAGVSLYAQPVWRAAHAFLQAKTTGFTPDACVGFGQSLFFQLGCLTDIGQHWPNQFRATVSANRISTLLTQPESLGENIDLEQKNTFAHWTERAHTLLKCAGWPQEQNLNSVQFQAFQAIERALEAYVLVENSTAMSFSQAMSLLGSCLQQRLFAPQRLRSDIWVLGLLETTGLSFTHLWVCGMDENSFPGKSLTSPFIPRGVAMQYKVPRSTQADELNFARRQLLHWRSNAKHLRFSYCMSVDDNEQHASPLLDHLETTEGVAPKHPNQVMQHVTLDNYVDDYGLPLEGNAVNGGTGFLKDQAICPFKAYAQYRLKLRQPIEHADFPNALVRGNLLHDTLFELVRQNSSQTALAKLSASDIQRTSKKILQAYPLQYPPTFVEQEVERITALITRWLEVEAEREPFEALYLEETFTLVLSGLEFRIRIDRVDKVEEQLFVIDYKTGKVSLSGLTSTPTTDPQLPAYSLIDDKVKGVYYAEVRAEPILKGVGDEALTVSGAHINKLAYTWSDQREVWRKELTHLVENIAAGEASVTPTPRACDYCHLHSMCRIGDQNEH